MAPAIIVEHCTGDIDRPVRKHVNGGKTAGLPAGIIGIYGGCYMTNVELEPTEIRKGGMAGGGPQTIRLRGGALISLTPRPVVTLSEGSSLSYRPVQQPGRPDRVVVIHKDR